MPNYNTIHDGFPYLYLFWGKSYHQSSTLYAPSKVYGWIRLEKLLSAKFFYFWTKTTRSDCRSLLFPQFAIDETWISRNFPNVSSTRDENTPFFSQDRWNWIRLGRIIHLWCIVYVSYLYLCYPHCKLGWECQQKNDDTSLLHFYSTVSYFSRYNCIQRDCMILRNDAFIIENAELQSCFMRVIS